MRKDALEDARRWLILGAVRRLAQSVGPDSRGPGSPSAPAAVKGPDGEWPLTGASTLCILSTEGALPFL